MEMSKEEIALKAHEKGTNMLPWGDLGHFLQRTNIDRRKCHRVVPMEVLGLGPSRCGTSSLRKALFLLGYYDVYHMTSYSDENPNDDEMWLAALEAKFQGKGHFGREEWDQLLGHCMAVTDLPCNIFVPELVSAYPDAKVVLAAADSEDAFYDSWMHTLWPLTQLTVCPPNPSLFDRFWFAIMPRPPKKEGMLKLIPWVGMDRFPENGKQYYREHNELVRRVVPKERLLEYNVKQGWEPLCRFLGKEVPDVPFPHVNERKVILRNINRLKWFLRITFVGLVSTYAGAIGVVGWGLWWAKRR